MELLYEGVDPPGSFKGLVVLEDITEAEALTRFTAGRLQDDNYSLIVRSGTFTGYYNPPAAPPDPMPMLLSKTAFQDYAISQLGGGVTGMARFTEIMDATRDSASGAVRFAFARYEAAITFEKNNTALLTNIMVNDTQAGHLTAPERAAIIDNWPTG